MELDFSFWGSLASVISFFLTVVIAISLFFIRSRFLVFGIEQSHVESLQYLYKELSSANLFGVVPASKRSDLKNILTLIKRHYESKWLSKRLYKKVLTDIDVLIKILDEEEDCTKHSLRLHIKTIVLKIEKNPRLDYAIK